MRPGAAVCASSAANTSAQRRSLGRLRCLRHLIEVESLLGLGMKCSQMTDVLTLGSSRGFGLIWAQPWNLEKGMAPSEGEVQTRHLGFHRLQYDALKPGERACPGKRMANQMQTTLVVESATLFVTRPCYTALTSVPTTTPLQQKRRNKKRTRNQNGSRTRKGTREPVSPGAAPG